MKTHRVYILEIRTPIEVATFSPDAVVGMFEGISLLEMINFVTNLPRDTTSRLVGVRDE